MQNLGYDSRPAESEMLGVGSETCVEPSLPDAFQSFRNMGVEAQRQKGVAPSEAVVCFRGELVDLGEHLCKFNSLSCQHTKS